MMVISVGDRSAITGVLADLPALSRPQLTLERVEVCKRDGVLLAEPSEPPVAEEDGLAYWRKLSVYAGEQTRHDGEPLYSVLVRRLRAEGAAGATVLRGLWGFHGEHRPHGEHLWSIRRRVPVLTTVLDTPANARRWFEVIDAMTQRAGLVTSELVPVLRAGACGLERGGLELARAASRARGSLPPPGGVVPPREPYSDQ
jgi:PII-like signaling protein